MAFRDDDNPLFAIRNLLWKGMQRRFLPLSLAERNGRAIPSASMACHSASNALVMVPNRGVASERSVVVAVFHAGLLSLSFSGPGQFTPGSRTTLRTRPPLPHSDREYTPARSADRHLPEAHWRNPSILSPAVTATGTTFCAA